MLKMTVYHGTIHELENKMQNTHAHCEGQQKNVNPDVVRQHQLLKYVNNHNVSCVNQLYSTSSSSKRDTGQVSCLWRDYVL